MNAIDTNVLIYSYDDDYPGHQQVAKDLLAAIAGSALPWQVASEFLSVSRKLLRKSDPPSLPWDRLSVVRNSFKMIFPSPTTLDRARHLQLNYQLQIWDALIYAACLDAAVTTLYSEDLPAQPIPGLQIINPFAHLPPP